MAFDIEGPRKGFSEMTRRIDTWEKELAALKLAHPRHAQQHAENAARAKMKGGECEKPTALVEMEVRIEELEEFLPNAREVLRKDQLKFAQEAAAYLRTKRDALVTDAEAKRQAAYDKVAAALEELAGVIGVYQARDVLQPGEHSRWIRERLDKLKLPEAGLDQQATALEYTIKSIAESQGRGCGQTVAARAALFRD